MSAIADAELRKTIEDALTSFSGESEPTLIEARSTKAAAALRKCQKAFNAAVLEVSEAEEDVHDAHSRLEEAKEKLAELTDELLAAEEEVQAASVELQSRVAVDDEEENAPDAAEKATAASLKEIKAGSIFKGMDEVPMPPGERAELQEKMTELADMATAMEVQMGDIRGRLNEASRRDGASTGAATPVVVLPAASPHAPQHYSKAPPPPPPLGSLPAIAAAASSAMEVTEEAKPEEFPVLGEAAWRARALSEARKRKGTKQSLTTAQG